MPVAAALLVIVAVLSLRYGALDIDTATVWNALWDYDRGDHAQIVYASSGCIAPSSE